MKLLTFLLVFLLNTLIALADYKCVNVTGYLRCEHNPEHHNNILIELFDHDSLFDFDDFMGKGYSSEDGEFQFRGCGYDYGSVPDPYLHIKHKCNSFFSHSYSLPVKYIFEPYKYYTGVLYMDEGLPARRAIRLEDIKYA